MNFNFKQFLTLICLAVLLILPVSAQQNTLTQTSLSNAINAGTQQVNLASATGITATPPTLLFIDKEAMLVLSITSTNATVARGQNGTAAAAHINTSVVLAGRPNWFAPPAGSINGNPSRVACTTATTVATPYVDIGTGLQSLCSTITLTWVPGFGNTANGPPGVTLAVASAAGQILPSGPLFHVTGTAAVTGFTYPIGMGAGQPVGEFCVIPDGAFTWTTANNIALAGTAVVNRKLCFSWDYTNLKWVPSYV